MEFLGFAAEDFDFFKKKEGLNKKDYDKLKEQLKHHFRELCYEIQKIYHTETGDFFDITRDFQNFNKKSSSIFTEHILTENNKIRIEISSEAIEITRYNLIQEFDNNDVEETFIKISQYIKNLNMVEKNFFIYSKSYIGTKKPKFIRISGIDITSKKYEELQNITKGYIEEKLPTMIGMGFEYPKKECIKLGKGFTNTSYNAINKLMVQ